MQISLPTLSPVARILWILLVVLVGGFLLGRWLNRRRSKAIGEWLQLGVGVLGAQTSWRFPGGVSSGAEVKISSAAGPFRQVEISYHLLTRELPFLWGWELLRGKRDTLAMRADLRAKPRQEYEVVPLHGVLRRTLDQHAGEHPWRWAEMPSGLGMATRDPVGERTQTGVRAFLDRFGGSVQRLSVRERSPNLVLFVRVPGIQRAPAKEFLQAVRRLVGQPEGKIG
jgi:hypothetical protein